MASQLRDSDARVRELQVKVKELLLDSSAISTRDEKVTQLEQQLAATQTDLLTARNHLESSRERTVGLTYQFRLRVVSSSQFYKSRDKFSFGFI